MPRTQLFTSIPARVSRPIADGRDVGPGWTRACIASWQQAGYDVVSVNAASEAAQVRAQFPGVRVAEVARDGSARSGRPMVFVADIIALMAASRSRAVAVANADVLCRPGAAARLRGWQPDGFAYSNRLDIACPAGSQPRLHGGVDFLLLAPARLHGLVVPDFLFGTPWWDYWLPLALMARGVRGTRLAADDLPLISHLVHADRWNARDFVRNHALFVRGLAAAAEDACAAPPAAAAAAAEAGEADAADPPDALLQRCLEIARATSATIHRLSPVTELAPALAAG